MDNENMSTIFDTQIQSRELQMLKTVVPYMEWKQQKTLAIFIKYMELQKAAHVFSAEEPSIHICETTDENEKRLQMLTDISKLCTDKEKENIDLIINMFQMFSTYEVLFT